MLLLILKFLAGIIAATIATKIVILKTGHEGVGPWHVGKWRFTTEALLSVGALWLAFAFSTGTDVLKYRGDARTAADQRKKSEELINRQNEIRNLAATANDQIDRAANNLAGVAKTTTETLDSVNTANSTLKASAGTLNQVVQRQIDATATASETLGRLTETSTLVRRSSKPLRPLEFTLHVKYEYGKTSDEIRNFVNNVKSYVDNIGLNDKARGDQRQRDNWTATPGRIRITGPSALLALGGGRVEQILTSGTVGIKIRPTETESEIVTNDQVAMIAHAGFTNNPTVHPDPSFTVVPQPSDLQIIIDRRTGDITELFFLKRVDATGALFGINSMYDLPSKWLELSLPSPVELRDNPKVTFLAYRNDTFITGGKFPESIILIAERFKGPFQLERTRANPEGKGVAFRYPIREDDLNSAALFEKQRQ